MVSGSRLSGHPETASQQSDPDEEASRRRVKHAPEEPESATGSPTRRGRARDREVESVPHPGREVWQSKEALRAALELDGRSLQPRSEATQMTFARGLLTGRLRSRTAHKATLQ